MNRLLSSLLFLLFFWGAAFSETFRFSGRKTSYQTVAGGEKRIVLSGEAEVFSDSKKITGDQIRIYGPQNRFIRIDGNAFLEDREKKITLKARHILYDRARKILTARDNVEAEDRENESLLKSRYLEFREKNDLLILQIGVRILKKDATVKGEYVSYQKAKNRLEVRGFPVIYKGDDRFEGDVLLFNLKTEEISLKGETAPIRGKIFLEEEQKKTPEKEAP